MKLKLHGRQRCCEEIPRRRQWLLQKKNDSLQSSERQSSKQNRKVIQQEKACAALKVEKRSFCGAWSSQQQSLRHVGSRSTKSRVYST
jgi:hypothetical protein